MPGTTTFAYREDGMPSESQASPVAHHAGLSLSESEREELSAGVPPVEKLSQVDEEASQATSVSISLNTEAHQMVDNLLNSEAAENESNPVDASDRRGALPALVSEVSAANNAGIDTTYGFDTIVDTSDFIRAVKDYPAQQQPPASPRPHLPSIYNSPFAPQAGEATPRSRPGTAKHMSPLHSRHPSQKVMACPPQAIQGLESVCSSMPDPSSFVSTQTPMMPNNARPRHRDQAPGWTEGFSGAAHYGAIGGPILRGNGNSGFNDDSEFRSSEVFVGSNWAYSGQAASEAMSLHTPPNGQGFS